MEDRAKVFKALADERRLRILDLLSGGEACTCTLAEKAGIPQSSLSYHMKILVDAGLVLGRDEGKWTYYRLDRNGFDRVISLARSLCGSDSAAMERCG